MSKRLTPRVAVAACVAVVALLAAAGGWAHLPQFTYASGSGGVGGVYPGSDAYNHRDYNQVWHNDCCTWGVFYVSGGIIYGWVRNTSNPTKWPNEIGYATMKCENVNDNSGTTWTCQSTGG